MDRVLWRTKDGGNLISGCCVDVIVVVVVNVVIGCYVVAANDVTVTYYFCHQLLFFRSTFFNV